MKVTAEEIKAASASLASLEALASKLNVEVSQMLIWDEMREGFRMPGPGQLATTLRDCGFMPDWAGFVPPCGSHDGYLVKY